MALIRCPQCNIETSDQHDTCPYCNTPLHGGRPIARAQGDVAAEETQENPVVQKDAPKERKPMSKGLRRGILIALGALLAAAVGLGIYQITVDMRANEAVRVAQEEDYRDALTLAETLPASAKGRVMAAVRDRVKAMMEGIWSCTVSETDFMFFRFDPAGNVDMYSYLEGQEGGMSGTYTVTAQYITLNFSGQITSYEYVVIPDAMLLTSSSGMLPLVRVEDEE